MIMNEYIEENDLISEEARIKAEYRRSMSESTASKIEIKVKEVKETSSLNKGKKERTCFGESCDECR